MAFPTVQDSDTQHNHTSANATSVTLTYPTNIASGNLLIALVASDGGQTTMGSWPAGWVGQPDSATADQGAVTLLASKKSATGSETGTFSVTGLASEQFSWRTFRITDWHGTLGTTFDTVTHTNNGDVDLTFNAAGGASSNPTPQGINPAGWDTEDTLWIASCGVDTSRTISAFPSNFPDLNTSEVGAGSNGCTLGVAMLSANAAAETPNTFTISASDDWAAITIAVRPSAVSGTTYTKAGFAKENA